MIETETEAIPATVTFWCADQPLCPQHASSMWKFSVAPEWWFSVVVNSLQLAKRQTIEKV